EDAGARCGDVQREQRRDGGDDTVELDAQAVHRLPLVTDPRIPCSSVPATPPHEHPHSPVYHQAQRINKPWSGRRAQFQTPAPLVAPNNGTLFRAMCRLAGKTAINSRMMPQAASERRVGMSTDTPSPASARPDRKIKAGCQGRYGGIIGA